MTILLALPRENSGAERCCATPGDVSPTSPCSADEGELSPAPAARAPSARSRVAWLLGAAAAAVGISASVAALVASAIVSSAGEERSASVPAPVGPGARRLVGAPELCLDAAEGELCHRLVQWILEDGVRLAPERYAGVSRSTPFHAAQAVAHSAHPDLCPRPCGKRPPPAPSTDAAHEVNCDYGHQDSTPAHAGCVVVHDGKLLVERLTYDGEKYDIPGGQTDWHEPSRCTAYRETYEETGYVVAPRELLAVVRNDFHVYRCELLRAEPLKGHDHEISWVGWLDADEVAEKVSQGAWRFPEANLYVNWLR